MPFFLGRFRQYVALRLSGWRLPLVVAIVVFLTSWALMAALESDNPITSPGTYWWWYIVTSATVGYGDVFPSSLGGRIVATYVIFGGIVTFTILFNRLSEQLQTRRGTRMRGQSTVDVTGHTVLLGYLAGRSERIVGELQADSQACVVLCAFDDVVAQHPMPERDDVLFVRGDLTRQDVMARARVERAATVVVDARDDNEALAIAVAVDHAHPGVHLVVALRDLSRTEQLRYVNPDVQCVQWHSPKMLTEEAHDPGLSEVYAELMSSLGRGNTYSARLPQGQGPGTYGEWQTLLGRTEGATVLAMRGQGGLRVSPEWQTPLAGGDVLYYVASERLDLRRVAAADADVTGT